jgi:DNA-binding beta-propeller fold protein YncE
VVVLLPRARALEVRDARTGRLAARAAAGVGPTHVACATSARWCYVADTRGDGLLVFRITRGGRTLRLARRLYLPGGPFAMAVDTVRNRLWVTLPGRNELVALPAHGRPHVVVRLPTVRGPESVAVRPRTGQVVVTGRADGVLEIVTPSAP